MNQNDKWDQDLVITILMSNVREVEALNTQSKVKAPQMPNKRVDKMDIFLDQAHMSLKPSLEKKANTFR